jgi:glyoxylase-like metal-dependent hydrolase (beta-lactamase superfamily II)
MTLTQLTLGKFKIFGLRDGFFYLDGGAMFGVVPKTLWEKKCPADSENRIKMGLNSLLVQTPDTTVLIETGAGSYLKKQFYRYYSIERDPGLVSSLNELNYSVEDIDFVINTHLHFDHCGGNITKNEKGEYTPAFPKAKYIIQKGEWQVAQKPGFRDGASYLPHLFVPLEKSGQLCLVNGTAEVCKGVKVLPAPGHTKYHQCVLIETDEGCVFFLGDMIPMSAHVGLSYVMSYDLYPVETMENKKKYLDRGIKEDWIFAFNHDPVNFFGKIIKEKSKYRFKPIS